MPAQQTPATVALCRAGVPFSLHEYEHVPGTTRYGQEAVAALGVPAARVFKTLVARIDGRLAVGIVPVPTTVDLKALAAALGGKRGTLADPDAATRATGYVLGGISPVSQRRRLPSALDARPGTFRRCTSAPAGADSNWRWHRPTCCGSPVPGWPPSPVAER